MVQPPWSRYHAEADGYHHLRAMSRPSSDYRMARSLGRDRQPLGNHADSPDADADPIALNRVEQLHDDEPPHHGRLNWLT